MVSLKEVSREQGGWGAQSSPWRCLPMGLGSPQLRKAIEGSLTGKGVKVRPPLASFRDSTASTSEADTTALRQLWDRHQHHHMPREAGPGGDEDDDAPKGQ